MPALPLASPSSMYSGPPPPYSYPSSTTSSVVGGHTNGYISSPVESRSILNEDKKEQQQIIKQSLPSIHEALNREEPPSLSITSLLSKTPAPPPPSHSYSSSQSPTSPIYRSYREHPSAGPPPNPSRMQSSPTHHSESTQSHPSPRPAIDPMSARQPNCVSRESHYPPMLPPRTIPSPSPVARPSMSAPSFPHSSPAYGSAPRPAPTTNTPHAYNSYPTPYSYAPPMASLTSSHQPPSPSTISSWRYPDREPDRPEDLRRIGIKESMLKPSFGEAVKRHLDNFDLETSLNEVSDTGCPKSRQALTSMQIAEGSGRALEFSRHYGSRAHQTQRSGPIPGSMPSLNECDEMMNHQRRVLESIESIKEVIMAQQQALAEQRNYDFNHKAPSEADEDGASFHDKPEGAGGFAGADSKKRRGVRQHPFRCHEDYANIRTEGGTSRTMS